MRYASAKEEQRTAKAANAFKISILKNSPMEIPKAICGHNKYCEENVLRYPLRKRPQG